MFYQNPIVQSREAHYVGSTVIGIKYDKGIVVATDTRLNYGGLAKYQSINDRVTRVNSNTLLGASGEYSDFQEITRILREETLKDTLDSKGFLGPNEISNYISAICYYRRNKADPYLNSLVVGGVDPQSGKKVLYSIDQFGTKLEGDYFATGMGNYFSQSVIEPVVKARGETLTLTEATDLIETCFKTLYYRDCKAGNNIKYAYFEVYGQDLVYNELERSFKGFWEFDRFRTVNNDAYLR